MVRLCEQVHAACRWTVRRRLSNVARGAAEGLEGPAGTERLDPTLNRRRAFGKAVVQRLSSPDLRGFMRKVPWNDGLGITDSLR